MASFRSVSRISLPATTAESPRVETVVTGETRQYFENGMERMMRSRHDISEMKERFGNTPLHGQNFGLQSEALRETCTNPFEKGSGHSVQVDEVRKHDEVFLVEKPGTNTQRRIIGARVSNMHFVPPPAVSLVTSEGLSRVEVALEDNDEDPDELSKLAGLHLELADVKETPSADSKSRNCTAPSLPSLRCWVRKWEPPRLDVCAPASAVYRQVIPGVYSSVRTQSNRQCAPREGLRKRKSSRIPGAVSSHVLLAETTSQNPPTTLQGDSSMCMWITLVSWERRV